jgi:cystathionine beta-lyase/cystathionine gamma-synthase
MPDYSRRFQRLETNLLHAGAPRPNIEGAVVSPVFQSANYLMGDEATYDAVRYIRLGNSPNHQVLHARLSAIEGGEAALVLASGMAAITATIVAFTAPGGHLLAQETLYGGTKSFLSEEAVRFGIEASAIDITDARGLASWEEALRPSTRMVFVESISNPLMEVGDLEAIVEFARRHDLVSVIDNTFATPVNFRPLEHGFDLVVHSATKYLNGHSDIVAGVVVGGAEKIERIHHLQNHLGGALDPHACFLLERGLKTLALRVGRQNETALHLAGLLANTPEVRRVHYPGLDSDPGHPIARRLFSGFGGMLAFNLKNAAAAERFLAGLKIPLHAASLGGVESLVVRPARSSHLGLPPEQRARQGITDDLIRVSVGIEDPAELAADFVGALENL